MLPPSLFRLLHKGRSWPEDAHKVAGGRGKLGGRMGDQITQRGGERESGGQHARKGFPTAANTSSPTEEHLQTQGEAGCDSEWSSSGRQQRATLNEEGLREHAAILAVVMKATQR